MNSLFDENNTPLYNDLKKSYNISFTKHKEDWARCSVIDKNCTIYYNPENVSPATITHELLHCWFRTHEIYLADSLLLYTENTFLDNILPEELITHIGNCCEHVKIYPKYIQLGYKPNNFLLDSEVNKCTINEISLIIRWFSRETKAVEIFIGKFFSIHTDIEIDANIDYSICIKELKELDNKLYLILTKFWKNWLGYDITSNDNLDLYRLYIFDFYEEIKDWYLNRNDIDLTN